MIKLIKMYFINNTEFMHVRKKKVKKLIANEDKFVFVIHLMSERS